MVFFYQCRYSHHTSHSSYRGHRSRSNLHRRVLLEAGTNFETFPLGQGISSVGVGGERRKDTSRKSLVAEGQLATAVDTAVAVEGRTIHSKLQCPREGIEGSSSIGARGRATSHLHRGSLGFDV